MLLIPHLPDPMMVQLETARAKAIMLGHRPSTTYENKSPSRAFGSTMAVPVNRFHCMRCHEFAFVYHDRSEGYILTQLCSYGNV